MSKTIKLSLVSVALLSQLHAQESITLQPIAITSTAIATDELKSTDAVEVYTQKDIEQAHVQNVYEFLNQQTSLTTIANYGNPFVQQLDMHGYGTTNGNLNIVVTLNGRRLNNIDSVPQLLSSISPASIDKIEIIKSSGIVVGGDGANAGVINIKTKQNNDKEISFYIGNYGTVDGAFYVGHSDETLSISLTGEAQKNEGSRYIDANGNKDANKFSTATFSLAYTPSDTLELHTNASLSNIDVIYAGYVTQAQYEADVKQKSAFATHQKYETKSINLGGIYDIAQKLSLNVDIDNEHKTSDYVPSTGLYTYDYNALKASLDYSTQTLSLKLGYDGFYGDRKQSANKTTKNNNALYIMGQYRFGKNSLKAGYRYETVTYKYKDSAKDIKDKQTLHGVELGYNYLVGKQSSLFANYSHSYQAPVIDMFFKTDYSNWPLVSSDFNGFIKPMKANSYTLGYSKIQKDNKLKISLYYIDLTNEIYLHKPDFKNTNLDKSHKYGVDFYDKYLITAQYNIALNYNYVQAIIDDEQEGGDDYSNKQLPGVSNHNVKATLSYLPSEFSTISLTQIYRSEAYAADDFNNNFSQKQDAFFSTDISATYTKDNWEVFAKINNLFNQKNGLWVQDNAIYPINFTTTGFVGFKLKY